MEQAALESVMQFGGTALVLWYVIRLLFQYGYKLYAGPMKEMVAASQEVREQLKADREANRQQMDQIVASLQEIVASMRTSCPAASMVARKREGK